jgi:hypothetical protein
MKEESIKAAGSTAIDQQTARFLEELEGSAMHDTETGREHGSTAFPPSGEKGWGPIMAPTKG